MIRWSTLLLCLTLLFSCTGNKEQTFRFASSGEFHPFSYMNSKGELQGYDIEVGQELGKRLGLVPEPVMYKFAGIVEGIKAGRFDAAVASHTVTEARAQHVSFTTPYYYSGPQVFVRVDQPVASPDQLKGREIAVSKGSTYVEIAQEYTDKISIYDSDITALEALQNGRHDLVITDAIAGAGAIQRGLKIQAGLMLGESPQAIAVKKENSELLERLNQHLEDMRVDGTLKRLSEKYFGRDITRPRL